MEDFLKDWLSHPEYWFNKDNEYDEYIRQTYEHLLHSMWDREKKDIKYHLGYIIIYDQLPRHVYRKNDPDDMINNYLNCAMIIRDFVNATFELANLTAIEWVFFCLPVRHCNFYDKEMIAETWTRLKNETSDDEKAIYVRFLKATYETVPDGIHIEDGSSSKKFDYLDYIDVIGYCQFIKDDMYAYEDTAVYKAIENFVIENKIKKCIVSLSGGVDSMVCAFILKKLQALWRFELTAVHINYCNRSIKEYLLVRDWCAEMEIPLKIRHIDEIKRADCMAYGLRDTYESYTKRVRFQTYIDAWDTYDYPKVFMGHNYDDCFENILTNIAKKDRYDNLKGMTSKSIIDKIIFMRPMLSIHKKDIYIFAHNTGIPYLHDSTPSWSKRGTIRDTVRPVLEKWNSEVISAFFELAERVSEYEEITNNYVDTILTDQCTIYQKDHIELVFKNRMASKTIWGCIFDKLNIQLSNKSLQNFITQLYRDKHVIVVLNKTLRASVVNTYPDMTVTITSI